MSEENKAVVLGALSRRSSTNTTPTRPNASSLPTSSNTSLPRAKSRASRA